MTNYFVKWLPTKDEIEVGSYFKDTAGAIRLAEEIDVQLNDFLSRKLPAQYIHKPFLCSHDIQIGDKFMIPEEYMFATNGLYGPEVECSAISDIVFHYKSPTIIGGRVHSGIHKDEKPYKVIGEISPRAISFIHDGQEISERDITLVEQCPHYGEKHMWRDCSCKIGFVNGVVVRGPDGHYH